MNKTAKWKTFLEVWEMAIVEGLSRRQTVEVLDKLWQEHGLGTMTRRKMMSMYQGLKTQFAMRGKSLATITNLSEDNVDWQKVIGHASVKDMTCVTHYMR